MSRVMGIDYGDKNIGVAVSDLLGITAHALTIIRRANENSIKIPMRALAEIVDEYEIDTVVLGYPKNMNNTEGERCQKTQSFKERLEKRFKNQKIQVILWDERLSTIGAERGLTHLSKEKRDKIIDKMAAEFILQGYLDYRNRA